MARRSCHAANDCSSETKPAIILAQSSIISLQIAAERAEFFRLGMRNQARATLTRNIILMSNAIAHVFVQQFHANGNPHLLISFDALMRP